MALVVDSVSHSFLQTAQRCDKRLEYRYVRKIAKRVKALKPERGTWIHELLAAYYRALQKGEDGIAAARRRHEEYRAEFWDQLFEEEQEELGLDLPDVCWGIVERYVNHWSEVDKRWKKILMVEKYILVPVDWLPVPFGIKCDLVVLDEHNWVWIYDHNVVGSIPDEGDRALDNQGPRYILGMRELFKQKGIKVGGIGMVYDYIREKLPTKPAIKKDGKISTAQIDSDVPTVVQAIVENGEDPKDYTEFLEKIATTSKPFFERWPVPRSKELLRQEKRDIIAIARRHLKPRKHYPRHFDRTKCRWDCEYLPLCLLEREGGDIEPLIRREYVVQEGGVED